MNLQTRQTLHFAADAAKGHPARFVIPAAVGTAVTLAATTLAGPFVAGMTVGLAVAGLLLIWHVTLVSLGVSKPQVMGSPARWTVQQVTGLDQRRWMVLTDVSLGAAGDAPHVVVGERHVVVTVAVWATTRDSDAVQRAGDVTSALCRSMRQTLNRGGCSTMVSGVVVVWGPARRQSWNLPNGIFAVSGDVLREWFARRQHDGHACLETYETVVGRASRSGPARRNVEN